MPLKVSVVDLFAGPGGLGEGFSAFSPRGRQRPFHIEMSVEKEASAHRTLELRAFFRQFRGGAPDEYYDYLRGTISREQLFARFFRQSAAARDETLGGPRALGEERDDRLIYSRLRQLAKKDGPRVVIGGPPCQAYSLVGRARNKGILGYRAENDHRHFLYTEYLRVLWSIKPEVFVMENVKGILSSKVNGQSVFSDIVRDLSHPGKALGKQGGTGYRIYSLVNGASSDLFGDSGTDYVIRTENYGIPQTRHRVILLGLREDISVAPEKLALSKLQRVTRNVISDCPPLRSGLSKGVDSAELWSQAVAAASDQVAKSLVRAGLDGSRLPDISDQAAKLTSRGDQFVKGQRKFVGDPEIAAWYLDKKLDGYLNHESRGHIVDDLARYLYCACYAEQKGGVSPRAGDFPEVFAPKHANWKSGNFVDRFKVQSAGKPSSTITSHISKDGHYFIHYDPVQCRSLTVREAARLQTFPDNYFFEGNRTQQYVQVGNAVPPLLAKQIAGIVYRALDAC